MSIINQMLKDLEKRTQMSMNAKVALPGVPATIFYPEPKSLKKHRIIAAVLLFIACGIVLTDKFILKHHPAQMRINSHLAPFIQQRNVPSDTSNSPMSMPLHLTPSILTAITLQLDKDTTSLRLLLSQDVLYQVMTQQKNQLIILLENARLVTSLPPINTMNSAIKDIQMLNQKNGNLKIVLTLKTDADLTYLELNAAGKQPELQLDFFARNTTDVVQTQSILKNGFVEQQNGSIVTLRTDVSISDQYQQALRLSTQGHSNDAIRALTDILHKDSEFSAARESLASLLIEQGNAAKAQKIIDVGLQQRPFYPAYVQLKARILVDEGKINQALNLLQWAPPILTTNPDYHAFIAALYQRQGQPVFAEKLYEQLLALQPNNATWWMGLGIALESMGKQTLAMEAYLKAGNSGRLNPELKIYAQTRVNNLQR